MSSPSERDLLMARYSVQPMGDGAHSVYDRWQSKYVAHFSGRGAARNALKEWHTLIRSGRPGMDRNAPSSQRSGRGDEASRPARDRQDRDLRKEGRSIPYGSFHSQRRDGPRTAGKPRTSRAAYRRAQRAAAQRTQR